MKTFKKVMKAFVPVAAVLAMTACSDSGSGGGGGGTVPLADGGFIKEVVKGSTSTWTSPLYSASREQQLVLASDIKGSGYITSFSFRSQNTVPETNCPNTVIRMGHTGLSELTTVFADNVEQGKGSHEVVVNADFNISAVNAGEFFTITLDKPFYYNGVDNLVMDFNSSQACSNSYTIYADSSVHPNASLWTSTPSDASGALWSYTQNVQLNFAGGDNAQVYGAGLSHSYPFSSTPIHIQNLYTASDINGSGPITGYALQMNSTSVDGNYTMTVKMGHTSSDTLGTTFADNSSDFKVVASNVFVKITAGIAADDWVWIPLNGSFNYDGTDNVVVDIEVSASGGVVNSVNAVDIGGGVRLNAVTGEATGNVDGYINNAKFRFNGATMDVHSLASQSSSPQVLGDDVNGGQIQSLYKATDLGTSGKVTAVYVRMAADASAATVTNHKIYLGHTAKTSLNVVDTYTDNMDGYVLAYSGSTVIPDTLKAGDWLKLSLTTPFNYDGSSNLTVLFTGETDVTNSVRGSLDATRFSTASVGRNDNSVGIDGQPSWDWNGIVDIKLELVK